MKNLWTLALICVAQFGHTETLKVAIIDTGLDLQDPRFSGLLCPGEAQDFTGEGLGDRLGHGTHVAGLIKRYAGGSGFCLMILKYYQEYASGKMDQARLYLAMSYAIQHGAQIVNYSGGGPTTSREEEMLLRSAKNVTFVVAAGNDSRDLDVKNQGYYPASYPLSNVIAVGALRLCWDNQVCDRLPSSNYGQRVQAWEVGESVKSTIPCFLAEGAEVCEGSMTGTSMATAIHTGKLVGKRLGYAAFTH